MTRILACGDRQIGHGATWLPNGGRLADQRQVGEQIVDLVLSHNVDPIDLILDGGDVFEGPFATPEQVEAFIQPLERLEGQTPIIACSGNGRHDSAVLPVNALAPLRHVPGLTVASVPAVYEQAGCLVACLPWVHPGRYVALLGGGDRDEISADIADHLLTIAGQLRDECRNRAPSLPCVLLLHWAISGASLPTGLTADQLREPVVSKRGLHDLEFDAVVASHIHVPQLLWEDERVGLYTGSPMCHDHGEEDFAHGVWIVDVEPGRSTAEFVPLDYRPFVTIDCDGLALSTAGPRVDLSLFDEDSDVAEAIVRVRYTATQEQARRVDNADIRRTLLDAGAARVVVQPDIVREDRARVEGLDEGISELDAVDLYVAAQELDASRGVALRDLTQAYLETA
jgi:DNA repair exonuclease SbcCD nuclease subunit